MSLLISVCKLINILVVISSTSGADEWFKFASSSSYQNFKMVFESPNAVLARSYRPVSTSDSIIWIRMSCARDCATNPSCQAYNFNSNESHYASELLSDNYCLNATGRLALQVQLGSAVYDKRNNGMTLSCLDQTFAGVSVNLRCETAHPGCNGTWPNCNDCVQSCRDCLSRYRIPAENHYKCTLWPGGPLTRPIFANCYANMTYIMKRRVDPSTGNVLENYLMAISDMNRLVELQVHTELRWYFEKASGGSHGASYKNPYIDVNGTLSNLEFMYSYVSGEGDSLGLGGKVLAPAPFIKVVDDRDSCGQFWLLKSNNSLYCPGGGIGVFGTVQLDNSGKVNNSGIHWPAAKGALLTYCDIALNP